MPEQAIQQSSKASKDYWDNLWIDHQDSQWENFVCFKDLFDAYLPFDPKLRCLEIGCVPGRYLLYLHKRFGYQVHGVDYSGQLEHVHELFALNGVTNYRLEKADFQTWQPEQTFDVVVSFGFVEHFLNYEEVIRKHATLVAPGGWLIITMPNFRYGQNLLHRLCDRDNLNRHNLKVMDPKMLRRVLTEEGMTVLRLGYYGTFEFWVERQKRSRLGAWFTSKVMKTVSEVCYVIRHRNIDFPTPWFSPFIVSVARRSPAPRQ